ncbi:DNase I-like protein [Cubamyces sp. BRFM 1775]|nr:DNase I-like protein [Cubamyces sp. BRFM 1775]
MSQVTPNPMDVVLDLIHPSEEAKVAIEARSPPPSDADSETWSSAGDAPRVQRRKILAVVSHIHPDGMHEHGCVFVFSEKPPRVQSIPGPFLVEHAFPVVAGFAISMSQPRRATMDLSSPPPGGSFAINQPRTELTVTIDPGQDSPFTPITLQTNDIPGLRRVLDECKRLKEAASAEREGEYDFEPFGWVAPYIADDVLPPLLSPIPPDLRRIRKPVHTRLSVASAGLPGDDMADVEAIREDWMRRKVEEDLFARSEKAKLRIRIGTFNVNGKMPSQDLSAWVRGQMERPGSTFIPPLKEISPLSIGEVQKDPLEERMEALDLHPASDDANAIAADASSTHSTAAETVTSATVSVGTASMNTAVSDAGADVSEGPNDPDMLVLGFQELDLSAEALLYSTKTVREDAWCMAVFAGLGEKAALYEKLVSKQLVGMLLVIITKKRLRACFSEIRTCSVGAGIMGMLGNKGATAARIQFTPMPSAPSAADYEGRPVTLTFVNAHLAAFDEMFEKRNADFHDLSKRLLFDSGIVADESVPGSGNGYGPATVQLRVYDTDALFWLVDLNYRIMLQDADIRTLLASEDLQEENIKTLRRFDQLAFARRSKKAFDDFEELPIAHPPSYRFAGGVLTDSLGYDLKRKPAWTDRILHMASSAILVKQLDYASHPTITMSDHRPVSAAFEVQVPEMAIQEYEEYVERLWRDVSSLEYLEERPRVRVTPATIDFGRVSYKRAVTRRLSIENIGKVPCAFRFVPHTPTAEPLPCWLRISAMTGLVMPGENAELSLSVLVDDTIASQLNMGATHLEETLVLHTALGRDHFVAVTGDYERTCFATSISWLVRLPGPVRELNSPNEILSEDRGVNAPREIMRLVNWLMSQATDVPDLFLVRGEDELVHKIRECLDTGAEFDLDESEGKAKVALAVADTLAQLLDSLVEPVVPTALHGRCADMSSRDEAFELLDQLPVVNVNVWISLTAFLHFLGQQEAYIDKVERLVAFFTPILFRDDLGSSVPVSVVGKRNFLRYFIGQ